MNLTISVPDCLGCCFCHNLYGDNLPITLSGVTICPACYTVDGADYKFTKTGFNGSFTSVWTGAQWEVAIGTLTLTQYASGDGTCSGGVVTSETKDVVIVVGCTGENQFDAQAPAVQLLGFLVSTFIGAAPAGPNVAINNALAIGDCGFGAAIEVGTYGGTLTVEP